MASKTSLCKSCQQFDVRNISRHQLGDAIILQAAALKKSALGGCSFCNFMYCRALERYDNEAEQLPQRQTIIEFDTRIRTIPFEDSWICISLSGHVPVNSEAPKYDKLWINVSKTSYEALSSPLRAPDNDLCIAADLGESVFGSCTLNALATCRLIWIQEALRIDLELSVIHILVRIELLLSTRRPSKPGSMNVQRIILIAEELYPTLHSTLR